MPEPSKVYEETYRNYLAQLKGLDWASVGGTLNIRIKDDGAEIPFFGQPCRVSAAGITAPTGKPPNFGACIVLLKYLLMCPETPSLRKEWVTFKDFRDAAPLVGSFAQNVNRPLARHFSGDPAALETAAAAVGGQVIEVDISCDLALRFDPLPRVPLFLVFNDADEEFPASCSLFFEERAGEFLDMECLAIVGMLLAGHLVGKGRW